MRMTSFSNRNTSIQPVVLYCVGLVFCVTLAGCGKLALWDFDGLEKKALQYGTVSVGAARVIPYDNDALKESRETLEASLVKIWEQLTEAPITPPRQPPAAAKDSKQSSDNTAPWISEIETVGLRMAALKFVESELEDIRLCTISPTKCDFRRVVVSLDCSAWVRGKAGAALVYIDLYPYKADDWCHEAAKILKCWWKGNKIKNVDSCKKPEKTKSYLYCWNQVAEDKLKPAFECSDLSAKVRMPKKQDIDKERDPRDWVAFCHRLLHKNKLLPRIAHVERMGKAEYLTLAESDYLSSKLGLGFEHPAGPSAEYERETRAEAKRRMGSLRQLSLAFVAGDRRAGWFFMPGESTEGRMAPTERRLRIVVDVPKELDKLAIHVHKVFLGPDLGLLDGATFSKQVEYLNKTWQTLTTADVLYKEYEGTMPRHYRLIKTRMRNLLFQGWAEELAVDIPKSKKQMGEKKKGCSQINKDD